MPSMTNAAQSPLFEPVLWDGSGFKVLNELALPEKIEYLTVRELADALDAVKSMKTRAFGQVLTFLYSGALLAQRYEGKDTEPLRKLIVEMTQRFSDARPTFDFAGLGNHFSRWFSQSPADTDVGRWVSRRAREMAAQIVNAREARAERAARILPAPAHVLTHCNVSGELVAIAHYCQAMGKGFSVTATETRPYLQGTRLTAWELSRAGVPVSLIPDGAIAQVIGAGEVNAVLVGSDRCARNGDVINKVGTYPLALLAKEYGVPFYALVQEPGKIAQGSEIQIEERPAAELLRFQNRSLIRDPSGKIAARYPAFDITPASLVSFLIAFDGVFTPDTFRQKYGGKSALASPAPHTEGKYLLVYGMPQPTGYTYLGHALRAEKALGILVPEMRPELWGARVVAPKLVKRDLPATIVSDNMMGTLFARGEIQRLYLFYRGLSERGPHGICGSALAALLAKAHGVGVELLEAETETEAPADRDVSTFLGERVITPGVAVHALRTDSMPWSLFREKSGTIP
jgi:methylthioribose-1-phosphate isomerase